MCKGLLNKRTAVLSVFAWKYLERFLTVEQAQSKNRTHDEKLISTFTYILTTKVCYFWNTSLDTQRNMGTCNTEMKISFVATKVFVNYFWSMFQCDRMNLCHYVEIVAILKFIKTCLCVWGSLLGILIRDDFRVFIKFRLIYYQMGHFLLPKGYIFLYLWCIFKPCINV